MGKFQGLPTGGNCCGLTCNLKADQISL